MSIIKKMFSNIFRVIQYILVYFHNHVLFIALISSIFAYYSFTLWTRQSPEFDIYIGEFINEQQDIDKAETGISNFYLAQIGKINSYIKNENYGKGAYLLDGLTKKLQQNTKLHRYLLIKQALLYLQISENIDIYKKILITKFSLLSEDTHKSLISIYSLYKL